MNGDVVIRRLRAGEAAIYREVRLEALRDSPEAFATGYESAVARTEESWIAQADKLAAGSDSAAFLAVAGEPVGLAAIYRDDSDPSSAELVQMWVAPSHRGSGVAAGLLDHVFEWAVCRGIGTIRAEIAPGNRRVLGFYRREGFRMTDSGDDKILLIRDTARFRPDGL